MTNSEKRNYIQAMGKSVCNHLSAAVESFSSQVKDKEGKAILRQIKELQAKKEFLAAWDKIQDAILNSGGEENAIIVSAIFWYNMAQALRLIVQINCTKKE